MRENIITQYFDEVETTKEYNGYFCSIAEAIAIMGMTFAQKCTDSKSNEIPAVQKLLKELDISGCIIVTDALNCQKKTAAAITAGKGDYLLCAKDNQEILKNDIEHIYRIEQ